MNAERYRDNLMEVLHQWYPDGLPHDFTGFEISFGGKRYEIAVDAQDYERYQPTKPKSFSQRLTKTDKQFLSSHNITP